MAYYYDYLEIEKKGFEICYSIKSRKLEIGYIGFIDTKILQQNDIKNNLIYANINVDELKNVLMDKKKFYQPSVYPYIERDISILISDTHSSKKIADLIKKAGGKRLKDLYLFDVYTD